MRTVRRAAAALGATALAAALLGGCGQGGQEDGANTTDDGGGNVLRAKSLSVSYPDDWEEVTPGENIDAMAELRKDSESLGRISLRLAFVDSARPLGAANSAAATYIFGGRVEKRSQITLDGVDGEVWRNDYPTRESPGGEGLAPKGALIAGTDVVGMDKENKPFLVRINYVSGELSPAEVEEIVNSVTLSG
ncbi:hypothetical protein [Streptomyces gobiensis]|uniref:hypothetical protein n=1 Tax=Streptomyces gobiensis TaxID=2875706 RepID=UPI001E2A35A6|nr:hypothetical protein [Streptomyces gobiensis]UGY93375.1 hypothetical protein test1122_17750 [Streptomyces gobiensis]